MKKVCHYEVSFKGNLPKNLMIGGVPSREKQEELLRMTNFQIMQNYFLIKYLN